MTELLPWLNLLLLPTVGALWRAATELGNLKTELRAFEVRQEEHQRRLAKIESNLADLG